MSFSGVFSGAFGTLRRNFMLILIVVAVVVFPPAIFAAVVSSNADGGGGLAIVFPLVYLALVAPMGYALVIKLAGFGHVEQDRKISFKEAWKGIVGDLSRLWILYLTTALAMVLPQAIAFFMKLNVGINSPNFQESAMIINLSIGFVVMIVSFILFLSTYAAVLDRDPGWTAFSTSTKLVTKNLGYALLVFLLGSIVPGAILGGGFTLVVLIAVALQSTAIFVLAVIGLVLLYSLLLVFTISLNAVFFIESSKNDDVRTTKTWKEFYTLSKEAA